MTSPDEPAGLALLEARLDAFRVYADLVKAQEVAAEAGDLEDVERLSALRDDLQRHLDVGGELGPPAPEFPAGPPKLTVSDGGVTERERIADRAEQVQAETRRILLETVEAHERIEHRLVGLRDDTRDDLEGMSRRRSGIDSYVGRKSEKKVGVNIRF